MTSFNVFWVFSLIAYQPFFAKADSAKSLVPALYVFGDSSVDAGNNNYLNTPAKVNKSPYGIDLNNNATGRFSNGKTFADLYAVKLGLPLPPPYLGVSESTRYQVATGINYASGACGILDDTRAGECLTLGKQIEYFNSTVTNDLPTHFQSKEELRHHLSKSLYMISIGSNDYVLNYLPKTKAQKENKTPVQFADYLLEHLASKIKILYDLGARKFLIGLVGQIGCSPFKFCIEDVNQIVKPCSDKLHSKLQELQKQLSGSLLVSTDAYNFFNEIKNAPEKFGLKVIDKACYPKEGAPVCGNRKEYYFWDSFGHTTEFASEIYVDESFSGSKLCSPINVEQLVRAP
ncbi:hypothetical protein RIF29_22085 [Crotalaria pallida]|uniref:Uncharacterized protein n=1 Tax=Crotalaria pallida TaxID=3830 RepID=A0AAN9F6H4_CROPI